MAGAFRLLGAGVGAGGAGGARVHVVRPLQLHVAPPPAPPPAPPAQPPQLPAPPPRPRFVTTVVRGAFLPPPPAQAQRLHLLGLYSFASPPRPAPHNKHHTPLGDVHYSNLMHDKRVVRGSTIAAHPLAQGDGLESAAQRAARTRRRALARRAKAARLRPGTPPPAPGRRHHPIQTEYFLEELFDKGQEMSVGVQTDLLLDRPATPPYVPAKTGADAATQVEPGELFDFDAEVQPVLEVLVGKTAEQALAEVAQEEELAALREQQRRFRELRDAERAERARLAAQDARLALEKQRRLAQARLALAAAQQARERAAAAVLVQGYVRELLPAVLGGLRDQGFLLRRVERGVDEEFLPWLAGAVGQEVEWLVTARDLVAAVVRDVAAARAQLYLAHGEALQEHVEPEEIPTPPSYGGEAEDEELPDE